MSVALDEKELDEVKAFLSQYVSDHEESNDSALVRPNCYCMTQDEIEGEILDLVLTYLSRRNCGAALKAALARQTASELLKDNLESFEQGEDAHLPSEEQDAKRYDAMSIAKAAFQKLYGICNKWISNIPILYRNKCSYEISFDAIKNTRRKMEDKHFIMANFNVLHGMGIDSPGQALFSVFDGHGGIDAACYAASQLHCNLKKFEKLSQQPLEALRYAYTKTDGDFLCKAKRERLKSGSTGVTVFIQNDMLHIAWVGDSQVALGKNGAAVKLMDPHKPDREDERQRIEELGGCVVWFSGWRVNGSLAVSRAIGDYEQKPYVSSDADIAQYRLEGDEDYMILGCDGLWDTVDAAVTIELVEDYLRAGKPRSDCAKMLVQEAKSRGSMDNISVIVVFLDDHKRAPLKVVDEGVAAEKEEKENSEKFVGKDQTEKQTERQEAEHELEEKQQQTESLPSTTKGVESSEPSKDKIQ